MCASINVNGIMKNLFFLFPALLLTGVLSAEETVTGSLLREEQRKIDSHIQQADLQVDEARKDVGVDLTSLAWLRVVEAGAELDEASILMRSHPQKIAEWKGLFVTQTSRDNLMESFRELVARHGSINRVVLALQEDVSRMMGVDFDYIRTVLRTLKLLCEQTGDPKWCDKAAELERTLKSGNVKGAEEMAVAAAATLPANVQGVEAGDLQKIRTGPKDVGPGQGTAAAAGTAGGTMGSATSPGGGKAAAAQQLLDQILARYEATGDPRYKALYDELKANFDNGNYDAVLSGRDTFDQLRTAETASGGNGAGPVQGSGRSVGPYQLGSDNTVEIDGETYYFPNGFDQPGYLAGYTGGEGTRLTSERKIAMAFKVDQANQYDAEPKEIERRDWDLQVQVKDTVEEGGQMVGLIELVDRAGKTSFNLTGWEVRAPNGEVLLRSAEPVLKLPFSADLPNEVIITAKGESDWGSVFAISETLTL